MTTSDIEKIDKQINRLEQELASLYQKRVAALEEQLSQSHSRAKSLNGGSAKSAAPAPPKKRRRGRATASAQVKVAAAAPKKRRKRTSSKLVEKRILAALSEAGPEGLSLKQVSDNSGMGYQTVAKKLKELPQVVKKGSGKEGRYSLKG